MIQFIMDNQEAVMAIVAAAGVLGGLIVKLTPTKTDDKWYQKIKGMFGGAVKPKAE